MTVDEIKGAIAALSAKERDEVSAFMYHLRRKSDPEYLACIQARLSDTDPAHWLTPEDFERQLDQR